MKKIMMALAVILAVSLLSFGAVAYMGSKNMAGARKVNYNEEVHEAMQEAIESCDYDAWIALREENNLPMKGRMFQVINKENFCTYKELHEAMQSGDAVKAQEIRESLGLGQGMMRGDGMHGMGSGKGSGEGCSMQGQCAKHLENQGKNLKGNFQDADADGVCDRMQ